MADDEIVALLGHLVLGRMSIVWHRELKFVLSYALTLLPLLMVEA